MKKIVKASILSASSRNDVRVSGGVLRITGLDPIRLVDILSVDRKIARDEVSQVYTVGTIAPTIVAGQKYTVLVTSQGRSQGFDNRPKPYSTTAPLILSGSAATDRSNIYAAIAKKINADTSVNMTAVADVGGAGVSMTLTDKAGYYAARPSTRTGASFVMLTDGFINSTMLVQTVAPIYSFGIGSRMLQDAPVFGPVTGNLDSGDYEGFTSGVVAGQRYDAWIIKYTTSISKNAVDGATVGKQLSVAVYVDNGRGTGTSNSAGYIAIAREMDKLAYNLYLNDTCVISEFFEESPRFLKSDGISAPVGTAGSSTIGASNLMITKKSVLVYNMIGSSTAVAPVWTTAGLKIDLDAADTKGIEITPPLEAVNELSFIVGKGGFSTKLRVALTTIANGVLSFGFRKKGLTGTADAFSASIGSYTNLAMITTTIADTATLRTEGILNSAAAVITATAALLANATEVELEVQVDALGVVTCLINGTAYPVYSVGTTPLIFPTGLELIPFIRSVSVGAASPGTTVREWIAAGISPKY